MRLIKRFVPVLVFLGAVLAGTSDKLAQAEDEPAIDAHTSRIATLRADAARRPAQPFDEALLRASPHLYLDAVDPDRVWHTRAAGPDTTVLTSLSNAGLRVSSGDRVELATRGAPHAPVTFASFDGGVFGNGRSSITVLSDGEGVARVELTVSPRLGPELLVLAGSPFASGQVDFLLSQAAEAACSCTPNQGPEGPQGESGDQGPPGDDGPKGPPGPQGEKGLQGPQGLAGLDGDNGSAGPKGPPGTVEGPPGDQGPQGPQGEAGPKGPSGTVEGLPGDKGTKGDQGQEGLPGDAGPKGKDGNQGPDGDYGLDGDKGPAGPQGPTGTLKGQQGDKGQKGDKGLKGLKGDQGQKGDQGGYGPDGDKGLPGAQGPQGPMGPQGVIKGPDGDKGPEGNKGPAGNQGPQGPMGLQGNQGLVGAMGDKGPLGLQGDKGAPGDKGPMGLAGLIGLDGQVGDPGLKGVQGLLGDKGPPSFLQGPPGNKGAAGEKGLAGSSGPQGPVAIIETLLLRGPIGGQVLGGSASYVFVGPVATVFGTGIERLSGLATASLGAPAPGQSFQVGLCYESIGGGPVTNFVGDANALVVEVVSQLRPVGVAASVNVPSAGPYNVGFCVQNSGAAPINFAGHVNGWIRVNR